VPGHWEGDLVVGGATCLVTLVERSTRFLLMDRLDAHDATTVTGRLTEMVSVLPGTLSRTMAWDQGVEMAKAADFEEAAEVQDLLNGRPRKTLGWKTPAEALNEVLLASAI
jgi:IS30 family transposase